MDINRANIHGIYYYNRGQTIWLLYGVRQIEIMACWLSGD